MNHLKRDTVFQPNPMAFKTHFTLMAQFKVTIHEK